MRGFSRRLRLRIRAEMGSRRPNARLAKIHRSYSVEEASRLFNVHKNTVRNWLRQGLQTVDDQRPKIIRGEEMRRFLADRRARARQTCGPGRIYCLACRAPKVPAGNMVECVVTGDTAGVLQGICPSCDRMIYRRVNPLNLESVRGDLDITITQAPSRLKDTTRPNVNYDFSESGQRR